MKKALVMLLALALVGGLVFAQDIVYKTAPTISGSGTVTWGANFNAPASTGFVNAASATVNFPLVAKQTVKSTGDAIYGEVQIADIELDFGDSATTSQGSVTAKILLPSAMYITVYGAPGFTYNNAKSSKTYINDGWDDNRGLVKNAGWSGSTGGITFGMAGDFNFALKVGSVNAYNTTVLNTTNLYGIGADVGYKVPDLLTASAGFSYGPFDATAATGLTVNVNVAPKDTGLTLNAAMDLDVEVAATGMDIAADVAYALANVMTASASVYYGDADIAVAGDRLDAGVRLALTAVPNLSFDVGADMWGLTDTPANNPMLIFVGSNVAYKIMQGDTNYVKPYATIGYALMDANLYAKLGVEAVLFPKGVLTAQYAAGSNPANNTVTATNNAFSDDLGTFTVSCKLSY